MTRLPLLGALTIADAVACSIGTTANGVMPALTALSVLALTFSAVRFGSELGVQMTGGTPPDDQPDA